MIYHWLSFITLAGDRNEDMDALSSPVSVNVIVISTVPSMLISLSFSVCNNSDSRFS